MKQISLEYLEYCDRMFSYQADILRSLSSDMDAVFMSLKDAISRENNDRHQSIFKIMEKCIKSLERIITVYEKMICKLQNSIIGIDDIYRELASIKEILKEPFYEVQKTRLMDLQERIRLDCERLVVLQASCRVSIINDVSDVNEALIRVYKTINQLQESLKGYEVELNIISAHFCDIRAYIADIISTILTPLIPPQILG